MKKGNYSPRSPKSHIWRILNENDSEKCSHSPLCCAFPESFSFNLHSNLTFHQDFKIVVNRYEKRMIAVGHLVERMVIVGYVQRGKAKHIFSMRKANEREIKRYQEQFDGN